MEQTITQNSALYLAHHKVSKRRATLFRRLRTAASKQGPDAQRQLTSTYSAYFTGTMGAEVHRNFNNCRVMIAKKTPPPEDILLQG